MNTTRHPLDPITFPLHGSRLIEASAGTGKTWTIAALYVRLVLGHGSENALGRPLMPPDILVMTFTRAATRELSDRIRARLVEAVACFRGQQPVPVHDILLQSLLAAYPEGTAREHAAWRLAMAAECMDDAAIFTIDAWCQRMLREHAFDSGNLFDEELESDEGQRLQEAVQDYWRQQCYPLSGEVLQSVLGVWRDVDALQEAVAPLLQDALPEPPERITLGECVTRCEQECAQRLAELAQGWEQRAQELEDWLDGQLAHNKSAWDARKLQARYYKPWLQTIKAWARDPQADLQDQLKTGADRLKPSGLAEAMKSGVQIQLPPEPAELQALLDALKRLPRVEVAMRWHAAIQVQQRLQWLKRQARTFGFADMLQRLDNALAGDQGPTLRARILQQYPVALIDEFQDTSPLQYRLFDRIYRTANNDPQSALLLIGDPKQSIYGFRGADIYSYLRAREATQGRHYVLGVNYRSTAPLVNAVNHWFAMAEARREGTGAFHFRTPDTWERNPLPFDPVQAHGRPEQLMGSDGQPVPPMLVRWWDAGEDTLSADDLRHRLAQACAEQVVQWLNDPQVGFAREGQPLQRLRPQDIAILVRTGREAQAVRRELQRRHVASVYLSDRESVFASVEAQDLLFWLRAVAGHRDLRAVRAGLATRLMGLSLAELAWLASDEEALDTHTEMLRELHGVWQRQGILAMLRQTLHRMHLPARWLAEVGGERRLTNFLHLAELLQNASATLEGEQALMRWLATQIEQPGEGAEEQVVRLESDADLVKVVTVHKSKGLEYPVVLLPFAYSFKRYERKWVRVPQPDGMRRLELQPDEALLHQAEADRLREDLRLLYVALTRPRHVLWMGLGPLRIGNKADCVNHESAVGHLLQAGEPRDAKGCWQVLQDAAEGCAPHWNVEKLPSVITVSRWQGLAQQPPLTQPPAYQAQFDRQWGIGSFTALVRAMQAPHASQLAERVMRPADDEQGLVPEPAARRLALPPAPTLPVWHRFMRGELVGNFIHDQLEWLEGEGFALPGEADPQDRLAQRLLRRCERAGRQEQAQDTLQWLSAVVHHPLPPIGCTLAELPQRLPEMEFWLPVARLPAHQVDALCRTHLLPGRDRPTLPERTLHGMLMGFADLVFVHEGRYWVMDYKTNHLGPDGSAYHAEALAEAMLRHRYDVQAALYLLALHRLLKSRLGERYVPQEHLGGALYFFLRGLDGPAQAVHEIPPPLALLEGLEALLDEEETLA